MSCCPSHRQPLRYQQCKKAQQGRQQEVEKPKKKIVILSHKELGKEKGARPEGLKGLYDVELEVQARAKGAKSHSIDALGNAVAAKSDQGHQASPQEGKEVQVVGQPGQSKK